MKVLKEFLFGRIADPVCTIKPGYHTVHAYPHPTTSGDWVKEFRVGILFDKKAIEMINFLKRNIVNIRKTLEFYFLAAKTAELARVKLQNMKLVHGQSSAANVGMVIVQGKDNTVQLVDRIGV